MAAATASRYEQVTSCGHASTTIGRASIEMGRGWTVFAAVGLSQNGYGQK